MFEKVDKKAVDVIKELLGIDISVEEGDEINMCKAWDDYKMAVIREGIEKG